MAFSLPSSITPGRCIVFLICLSLTLVLSTSPSKTEVEPLIHYDVQFIPRQNPSSLVPSLPVDSRTSTTTTPSQTNEPTRVSSPTPANPSSTSTTSQTPTSTRVEPSSTITPPQPTSTTSFSPPKLSSIQSTGSDGLPTVVVVTVQVSNSNASPTATPPPGDPAASSSSGLGTGSIIGLSVAGGIALLGIIAFFAWKFTRRRRSSSYDDGEIKWPDLNSENHVPGVDDHAAPRSQSDHASIRDQSFQGAYGDGGLGASQSQVDLYAADPYAVPPLPHLNPNQPYRDDPAPYHDNFSAPPFHESRPSSPSIRGEVIPMNQINRARSPGPQAALNTGYGGRQSPGPQEAYGGGMGRRSPGPQDAYGGGVGRQSPGPQDAYGGGMGRQSPGPQDAYGGYGRRSPGPNDAYGPR